MIKKNNLNHGDKKAWEDYIKNPNDIYDKDKPESGNKNRKDRFNFDLHGLSLDEANKKVKEVIMSCSEKNYREILLITGKGLHSKDDDVYKSSKLNKLKYSVPEYINSEPEISKLILSVKNPSRKDGGDGALLIKLRKLWNDREISIINNILLELNECNQETSLDKNIILKILILFFQKMY